MRRAIASLVLPAVVLAWSETARSQAVPGSSAGTAPQTTKTDEVETGPVIGKWAPKLYGFVQFDGIFDTTQSFNELAGNAVIARPGTYPGDHSRLTATTRHSRVGFKFSSPEYNGVKVSATIEGDFLGNQPPTASESATFTSATFRTRHAWLKLETPVIDLLFGQTWQLIGWQPYFHPNTVEMQGVPGEVYERAPQIRLSREFGLSPVNIELAVAAARPPQRDAAIPDMQAGVKITLDGYTGLRTVGATGTTADAAAVGISGAWRHFAVANFSASPSEKVTLAGWAASIDAFVPIIPATMADRGNALTFTGSYARGSSDADLYTGLTGGVSFPPLPNPTNVTPAPTYTANIDNGLATFDASGTLRGVRWQSFIVGLQYYLPPSGEFWIAANYSHMNSGNMATLGAPAARVFTRSNWFDVNVFWNVTHAVRFGAEYGWFQQTYADDVSAHNSRVHFAAWYICSEVLNQPQHRLQGGSAR